MKKRPPSEQPLRGRSDHEKQWSTPRFVIYVALFVATFAVYLPVRHFAFVNYDDPFYVSHNPHLRDGLTLAGLRWAFTSGEGANWFPVTRLSHLLDAQFFGMQSGWPHLVNVLIHAFSVLLLFAFLERATCALVESKNRPTQAKPPAPPLQVHSLLRWGTRFRLPTSLAADFFSRSRWPSAFVALLFALHPLHVESVAWISERKDVLCTFFWMLSLWLWADGNRRTSLAAFCLGLMSKPMIVSLPFVLLLLDVWPLRRKLTWKQTLQEKAPFFVLSAVAAVVTYLVQQSGGAVRTFTVIPLGLRIENALVSYVVYIGQLFWPANLAVFYPYPLDLHVWQALLAAIVLAGISFGVLRVRTTYPYLAVGWFWYLITLAPVIGIIQVGGQAHADRYMYVPMIGLAIMLTWGAVDLLAKPVIIPVTACVCVLCAALTWRQTQYWRDSVSLFQHAVDVTKRNDIAEHNLGNALLELPDRLPDAIRHLQAALTINPDSASAHTDLGNALSKLPGRLPEAIAEYRAALRINADLPIPHSNLCAALFKTPTGLTEAIAECQTAVRLDPDFTDVRRNLGRALAKAGRLPEAVTQFETALRLEPGNPETHDELGTVLAAMPGRLPDAIAEYQEALSLKPDDQQARNNLGAALAKNPANLQAAIVQYQGVLQHDPNSAETQYNLGLALAKAGHLADAIAHFEAALRLDPNNAEAHNNLGFALTNYPARLPEAIGHFQAALRANPNYADAHYNLGVAYANTGRIPEAIQQLENADRLKPDPELEQLIKKLRTGS